MLRIWVHLKAARSEVMGWVLLVVLTDLLTREKVGPHLQRVNPEGQGR